MKTKEIVLQFKSLKELDSFFKSIRNCVKKSYCVNMLDHYYYNDKGKKIKRGKNDINMIIAIKEVLNKYMRK